MELIEIDTRGVKVNKKLFLSIAAGAVVSLPVLAADNSTVTIYGRVNVSLEKTEIKNNPAGDATKTQVVDNSSRIGFRGKEELGANFAAIFQVESRVRADSSGDAWASRDSFVGLEGGFGTLRLGAPSVQSITSRMTRSRKTITTPATQVTCCLHRRFSATVDS